MAEHKELPQRKTLADYIAELDALNGGAVLQSFNTTFPSRSPEEAVFSHFGTSWHEVGYTYYKFAHELKGNMFVTKQTECSWSDTVPDHCKFFYERASAVYKNSKFALEKLKEETDMHDPEEINRYIEKEKTLANLYKRRYEIETEMNALKRSRMAEIDREIAGLQV